MEEFAGYTIIRRLPPGGMTDLYLALDRNKNRMVIRCLRDPYAGQRKWRKSFFRAAKILSEFDHPNIIRIYDASHVGKQPYMVLEYIEAQNLRSLILHRDEMMSHNALHIMRQMAEALYQVHRMGYLHLDFKPDNILVREDASAVLIDFDLVTKSKSRPVRLKRASGTPFYMPPETLAHNKVDERTDVYAWGVTAYEMLAFHKPFEANTIEKAHAAQTDKTSIPDRLKNHNPEVPDALESIILKCLAKAIEARYPSMGLVLKDLKLLT